MQDGGPEQPVRRPLGWWIKEVDRALDRLRARGLVGRSGDRLALTAEGGTVQRAVAARVDQLRSRVAAALPDEGCTQLVQLLAQVVDAVADDDRHR